MKFIIVLFITALATVTLGTALKKQKVSTKEELISPIVAGTSDTTSDTIYNWPVFVNNFYGYKIKHPLDVNIKNQKNGDISLQKQKSINISITQDVLLENDTVNTLIEKTIDKKRNELGNKFNLLYPISPIALGQQTAQTYTSEENGQKISFFYILQKDKKYLLISNFSTNDGGVDYLTSEDIIYSLEFFP